VKNFVSRNKKSLGFMLCLFGAVLVVHLAQRALGAEGKAAMTVEHPAYNGQLTIPINKSQSISVHEAFAEVSIGNPEIADVVALSRRSLYVLGKKIGSTNLAIRGEDKKVISVMDVVVTYDVDALKAKMHQLAPGDVVEVRPAEQSIVLSGQVANANRLRQLVQVAEQYAPGKVTNMLTVGGSQQVLLKVRFAEVQRSALKDIGFSDHLNLTSGSSLMTVGDAINPETFLSGTASLASRRLNLLSTIDALEQKGLVRTLAEPNIIALSGDNAKFLAGGEFPIPVVQSAATGSSSISVEFKQFGVGLSFTPTVVGAEAVNLLLDAEVSSIDPTVSVKAAGIEVPGLKTRKISTTIELQDGQSFAIAGLIEDNFNDTIRAVPGLGSIPIIGILARSTEFQRHQTELVVIIEAHLVQPTTVRTLASPTDTALPPSEFNLFMMGETEQGAVLNKAAGVDGPYGYVLP